jgi:hypothetical protein
MAAKRCAFQAATRRFENSRVNPKTGQAQVEFEAKKITPEKIVAAFNQRTPVFDWHNQLLV